ncbi:MAG: hypothetical protein ABI743_12610, partial [bacterium]
YMARYDPVTGATLGGFNNSDYYFAIGIDGVGDLLVVANPGNRNINKGLVVADKSTQTVKVAYSQTPNADQGQDSQVAIDRDGYIHLSWQGNSGTGRVATLQVYEYIPPSTLAVLYTYTPSVATVIGDPGLSVSRPNNVVCFNTYIPSGTFQHYSFFFK